MSDRVPALSVLVSHDGLRLSLSYASPCAGWPHSPEAGVRAARTLLEEALKVLEAPDRVRLVASPSSLRHHAPGEQVGLAPNLAPAEDAREYHEDGEEDRREWEIRRLRALLDVAEDRACRAERDLRRQHATIEALLAVRGKVEEATELDRPPPLTPREGDVLYLIGEGLSNREIGEKLFISERTVRKHAEAIFRKLGVAGRSKAVACARRLGLL